MLTCINLSRTATNASAKDGLTSAPARIQSTVSTPGGAVSILGILACAVQYATEASSVHVAIARLSSKIALGLLSLTEIDLGFLASSMTHD
jgi:hypothetical protein